MALGELKFLDRLIYSDIRPFVADNLFIMGLFMIMVPIALINLLIGVAVGDIESIRNMASMNQLKLKVSHMLHLFYTIIKHHNYSYTYGTTLHLYFYHFTISGRNDI